MTILAEMTMVMKEDHDDDRNKEQALIETFYYCENVVGRRSAIENDNNAMQCFRAA